MTTEERRDMFAAAVLVGYCQMVQQEGWLSMTVATKCFDIADAMLAESAKRPAPAPKDECKHEWVFIHSDCAGMPTMTESQCVLCGLINRPKWTPDRGYVPQYFPASRKEEILP